MPSRLLVSSWILGASLAIAGCRCGSSDAPIDCSTSRPTLDAERTIGRVRVTPDERRLRITGLPEPSRWVLGRGPALTTEPFAPVLDAIEGERPDAILLLGSFGRGARLEAMIEALASFRVGDTPIPILLVPGPRDRLDELDAALRASGASHLISLAGFHAVDLGGAEWLIAAGGLDAHYVLEGGCHLEDLADVLAARSADRLHVLVGFDAPAGTPLTAGIDGVEAGSESVRAAMASAQIEAGVFAGPDTRLAELFAGASPASTIGVDRRIIVPPIVGPAQMTADGARVPSAPTLLSVGRDGIGLAPTAPSP